MPLRPAYQGRRNMPWLQYQRAELKADITYDQVYRFNGYGEALSIQRHVCLGLYVALLETYIGKPPLLTSQKQDIYKASWSFSKDIKLHIYWEN